MTPLRFQAIQINGYQWVIGRVSFGRLITVTEYGALKTMQEALGISNKLNGIKASHGGA